MHKFSANMTLVEWFERDRYETRGTKTIDSYISVVGTLHVLVLNYLCISCM